MRITGFFTLNQRLAARLGASLVPTPLSPNHAALLSMGAGLASGHFFSQGTRGQMVLGAIFFHLTLILGFCAGEMVRAKGLPGSRLGEWFRLAAGGVAVFALWSGLALGAASLGVPATAVRGWWLAAMVGSLVCALRGAGARSADPTLWVYALALLGSPWLLLALGAVSVNALWILSWKRTTTPTS